MSNYLFKFKCCQDWLFYLSNAVIYIDDAPSGKYDIFVDMGPLYPKYPPWARFACFAEEGWRENGPANEAKAGQAHSGLGGYWLLENIGCSKPEFACENISSINLLSFADCSGSHRTINRLEDLFCDKAGQNSRGESKDSLANVKHIYGGNQVKFGPNITNFWQNCRRLIIKNTDWPCLNLMALDIAIDSLVIDLQRLGPSSPMPGSAPRPFGAALLPKGSGIKSIYIVGNNSLRHDSFIYNKNNANKLCFTHFGHFSAPSELGQIAINCLRLQDINSLDMNLLNEANLANIAQIELVNIHLGTIPISILRAGGLTSLALVNCGIFCADFSYSRWPLLSSLSLSYNPLMRVIGATSLRNLRQLTILSDGKMADLTPTAFRHHITLIITNIILTNDDLRHYGLIYLGSFWQDGLIASPSPGEPRLVKSSGANAAKAGNGPEAFCANCHADLRIAKKSRSCFEPIPGPFHRPIGPEFSGKKAAQKLQIYCQKIFINFS